MMKSNTSSDPSDPMFTKLNSFGALQRSFDILCENLCLFLSIALLIVPFAIVMGVGFAIVLVAEDETATSNASSGYYSSTTSTNTNDLATTLAELSIGAILFFVLFICLTVPFAMMIVAAMIRATAEIYVGEKPQFGAVLQVGVRNIFRLFCFGFVLLVPLVGMLLLGIAMASLVMPQQSSNGSLSTTGKVLLAVLLPIWFAIWTYIMIPFQMAQPSLVLEHTTVIGVVTRTWELASGQRLTIFLATSMLFCISFVMGLVPFVSVLWHVFAMPLSSM